MKNGPDKAAVRPAYRAASICGVHTMSIITLAGTTSVRVSSTSPSDGGSKHERFLRSDFRMRAFRPIAILSRLFKSVASKGLATQSTVRRSDKPRNEREKSSFVCNCFCRLRSVWQTVSSSNTIRCQPFGRRALLTPSMLPVERSLSLSLDQHLL